MKNPLREARVRVAFDFVAKANTVSILSLDEMEALVNRSLDGEFDKDLPPVEAGGREVRPGYLEVGTADKHVVVNHPDLDVDEHGCGFIVFSPAEARGLAELLVNKAHEAEAD